MKLIIHFLSRFFSLPLLLIIMTMIISSFQIDSYKEKDVTMILIISFAIIISLSWLAYIVYELRKLHIQKKLNFRNINISVLFLYMSLIAIIITPKKMYDEKSPDGNYRIKIYKKTGSFITMPGDGGFHFVKMSLYDKKGKKMRESCSYCGIDSYSTKIYWNIEQKYVSYDHCRLRLSKGECK